MYSKNNTSSIAEEFELKTKKEQRSERLSRIMPVIILIFLILFSITCPKVFLQFII